MHPFYNTYGSGGNVEHLYDDNWVVPQSNTPMKDIEGRRQTILCFFVLFYFYGVTNVCKYFRILHQLLVLDEF